MIAGVGFIDDQRGLSPTTRALAHTAAALWTVSWIGGLPALDVGSGSVRLGVWGGVLVGVLVGAWVTKRRGESVLAMKDAGIARYVELGGKVLGPMIGRTVEDVTVTSVVTMADIEALARDL